MIQWKRIASAAALLAATLALPFPAAAQAAASATAPSVKILSPAPGATVTSLKMPIKLQISNFKIDCARAGLPDQPGVGHIHVLLDANVMSQIAVMACSKSFTISTLGLAPGRHTLIVELADNMHMPIMGAVAQQTFNFDLKPSVSIVSPKNGATVPDKFDLKLDVKNFIPSCDLEGKSDITGYGHIHVFVDPNMKAMMGAMMAGKTPSMAGMLSMPCGSTIPVNLSQWKRGRHTIVVILVKNDHGPLMPMVDAMVMDDVK